MGNTAIVIGAGIVGLATARALCERGYHVTVIERNARATGASIRNFGMIWPVGQPDGILYERALLSRKIWKEVCKDAVIWHDETGSIHTAYAEDEWMVLQELADIYEDRDYRLLTKAETLRISTAVNESKLAGSVFSPSEMLVDPREAIAKIPVWLAEKFNVKFIWGEAVTFIDHPHVTTGSKQYSADLIFVCSGADFETLYPEIYSNLSITKCKLQMLRIASQPDQWKMGPPLCGGLSLIHYQSFNAAPSIANLRQRYEEQYAEYIRYGIHVMAAQNGNGEITVGDSHEYGAALSPFDQQHINELIIAYLRTFAVFKSNSIIESWHGVYAKLTNRQTEVVIEPQDGVTVINGLGGAGMTLSFGLCEQLISAKHH